MSAPLLTIQQLLATLPPWWAPHRDVLHALASASQSSTVRSALNSVRRQTDDIPRFVEPSNQPAEESYEGFIFRTDCVPTRENLHDLFNGVMWLSYPHTKRRLNALQAGAIATHGIGSERGALRDALTLFDENAALLSAPPALIESLHQRDWQKLFIEQRAYWQSARIVLFGHALLEKLLQPRKAVTAHVWIVDELTDAAVAASLDADRLAAKPFLPLPLLGVPGWWDANEEPGFYDDAAVFRPLTRHSSK